MLVRELVSGDGRPDVVLVVNAGARRGRDALERCRSLFHVCVTHVTTRAVRLVTDVPHPVDLDGEVTARTPTFVVERNALHVAVPERRRAAHLDGPLSRAG